MSFVLDASVALSWLFERERGEERSRADAALERLSAEEAVVPALWHAEIVNALVVAQRRGVLSEAGISQYLTRLSELPITTDETPPSARREAILGLARDHGLSAYDATYLDLALRNRSALATFDAELASAMRETGGEVFEDA